MADKARPTPTRVTESFEKRGGQGRNPAAQPAPPRNQAPPPPPPPKKSK